MPKLKISKTEENTYEVQLQNAVTSLKIKATAVNENTNVKIGEDEYSLKEATKEITLDSSLTEAIITVKTEYGTEKQYTLKINTLPAETGLKEVTVGNNVTADKAVREALSIGINRQTIIDHALNGIGVPAVHFTNNLVWASTDTYEDGKVEEGDLKIEDIDGDKNTKSHIHDDVDYSKLAIKWGYYKDGEPNDAKAQKLFEEKRKENPDKETKEIVEMVTEDLEEEISGSRDRR